MTARRSTTILICMLAFSLSAAAPLGFTRLRSFGFPGSSCEYPQRNATLASDGHLYVTTLYGGASREGPVFLVRTASSRHELIHSFGQPTNDRARPSTP